MYFIMTIIIVLESLHAFALYGCLMNHALTKASVFSMLV